MCVKRARLDQIPVLIERGADINARNTSGKTPLFEVVKSCSVVDVERMILWGADPCVTASLRNLGEVTLVEYLLDKSNFVDTPRVLAIVRVLRSFGAPAGERVVRMLQSKDRECYWSGLVLWTGCFEGCWLLLVVLCPLVRVLVG